MGDIVKNYYSIIGVNPSDDKEIIKSACNALINKYLPNKDATTFESALKVKEINEAYRVLLHPGKRAKHDQQLNLKSQTPIKVIKEDLTLPSTYWSIDNKKYKPSKLSPIVFLVFVFAVLYAITFPENRFLIIATTLYFLPSIICLIRKSCIKKISTILRNIFLGWTLIYWVLLFLEVTGLTIESIDASQINNKMSKKSPKKIISLIEYYGAMIEDDCIDFGECIPDTSLYYAGDWLNLFNEEELIFIYAISDVAFSDIGIYVRDKWRCRYDGINNVRLNNKEIIINDNFFIKFPSNSTSQTVQIIFAMLVAISEA